MLGAAAGTADFTTPIFLINHFDGDSLATLAEPYSTDWCAPVDLIERQSDVARALKRLSFSVQLLGLSEPAVAPAACHAVRSRSDVRECLENNKQTAAW